jgi:chromate transporter
MAYVAYGALPTATGLLFGVKPAVLAIIAAAVWKLGRAAVKNTLLALLGAAVLGLYLWIGQELALLLGSGALGVALARRSSPPPAPPAGAAPGAACLLWLAPAAVAGATPATPWAVGLYFLKIGSVLFGGGYVLLAFLQDGLVRQHGWLTEQQLLDAVAVGQFTPGPVFSTATFIGYVIAGWPGAIAATVGIFLPSFFFVWATHPVVPRLRKSAWAGGFLDGVNVGSVALMTGVCLQLARTTFTMWPSVLIALLALFILLRTRLNAAWLIAGAAALGLLLQGSASTAP